MNSTHDELLPGAVYLVELCSGEQRHWQYLGPFGPENQRWWDIETEHEFGEASVLYAWKIIQRVE
ncbi:hypothetical protein LZ012_13560 [Dechloromonas sp. XY25]|uniref:Uncharacterized protein n=1 Tax=Dechloromonas hankyongensis TaxID=2908002 RepID=A0ABS9K4E9_9RHOO|nr:hypothetical protein [Dechloromonas hankyongensis]MCG2578016.1 hypothetical protein [Dechloromonas hankyongensis]